MVDGASVHILCKFQGCILSGLVIQRNAATELAHCFSSKTSKIPCKWLYKMMSVKLLQCMVVFFAWLDCMVKVLKSINGRTIRSIFPAQNKHSRCFVNCSPLIEHSSRSRSVQGNVLFHKCECKTSNRTGFSSI